MTSKLQLGCLNQVRSCTSLTPSRANSQAFARTADGECYVGLSGLRQATGRRRHCRCRCSSRDPLDREVWNSWQHVPEEWETETFTEDELVDILFEEDGSAETTAQNVLAVALSLILLLAVGGIVWRIVIVAWALISAALRYSVVALMLVMVSLVLI